MLSTTVRSTKGMVLIVGALFFVAILVGLTFNHLDSWDVLVRPKSHISYKTRPQRVDDTSVPTPTPHVGSYELPPNPEDDRLRKFFLQDMYKPVISPNEPIYRPHNAFEWRLPEAAHWQQRMGENLCIIDLDNRGFNNSGEIFGPDLMSWDSPADVHGLSAGLLNHYVYARIHGYKYYYVNIVDPGDRRASWKKPTIISKILKEHDVCIYLDSDAIFHNLDLPFEWLLNYWQLYPENNSMALAIDPEAEFNKDKFGKLNVNTGFIISQNSPTTYKIMDDWSKCPDDNSRYPGCDQFRKNWPGQPTDQGGFGSYVRYSYPNHIRELPCDEANGFPQTDTNCHGTFIRHLWTGKDDQIKIDVGQQMPGPFLKLFHHQFLKEKKLFYIDEADLLAKGPSKALRGNNMPLS